jgi:hypothetical protein
MLSDRKGQTVIPELCFCLHFNYNVAGGEQDFCPFVASIYLGLWAVTHKGVLNPGTK